MTVLTLTPGTRLGRYEIRSQIGAGGMGEVYLARDTKLDREVALKILPAELAADRSRMSRFLQEARAASVLNHPNIITIHEIDRIDRISFIVTEFINGETLRQRMKSGPMQPEIAIQVATQVASALAAAHAAGIIHRDIKPENLMIRPDGLVKVVDFGLAKPTEKQSSATDPEAATTPWSQTDPGTVAGTAAYMSPEQARGLPVDARTDLFSLGIVLYEMIAGQSPFKGSTIADVVAAILQNEPAPVSQHVPGTPLAFERVVNKCLDKEKERRYRTAAELILDLKGLTAEALAEHAAIQTVASIAVLPFVNMSADAEQEYFCDGLAEELLNALAKIDRLKVAARTSSFSFKGKNTNVSLIGETLKVNNVLEGSVRKAGNRLRITVQLIDVGNGYHLWSERYDRHMEDIFDVQDEITLAVVDALKLKLLGEEKAAVLKRYTDNTEAYELYLKGRYQYNKWTREGWLKAIDYFEQAVENEPEYAPAHAAIGSCQGTLAWYGFLAASQTIPRSKLAVNRALEIDPDLAEAYVPLANNLFYWEWNWSEAERGFKRAIELNPNNADAHLYHGMFLASKERFDQAITEAKRALEMDPLSLIANLHGVWIYWLANHMDLAMEQAQKTKEIEPDFHTAYLEMGWVHLAQGKFEESIQAFKKSLALSFNPVVLSDLGCAYALHGNRDQALAALSQLLELRKQGCATAYNIARIYSGLGEVDQAFEWLEKAYEERDGEMVFLRRETIVGDGALIGKSVCGDPRLANLLSRLG